MQKNGEVQYGALLKKSWQEWKRNWWPLFVPDLLNFVCGMALFAVLLGFEIVLLIILGYNVLDYTGLAGMVRVPAFLSLIGLFLLIDYILLKAVAAYFQAMKIGLTRDVVAGKKIQMKQMWGYARKYFRVVFQVVLVAAATIVLPTAVLGMSGLIALQYKVTVLLILLWVLGFFYFIGSALFFLFVLYFMNPLLARAKGVPKPLVLMKSSWQYSKEHGSRFFLTLLITIGIWLALSIALFVAGLLLGLPFILLSLGTGVLVVRVVGRIVSFVVQRLLGNYTMVFVYNVCYTKE